MEMERCNRTFQTAVHAVSDASVGTKAKIT